MKTILVRHPWLGITAAYVVAIFAWIALVGLILHQQLS